MHEALADDPVVASAVRGRGRRVARAADRTIRGDRRPVSRHGGVVSAGNLQRQLARALSPVPVPIFLGARARPSGGSRRRGDAESEGARDFRSRSVSEVLRRMEPPGTAGASRPRTSRRRARSSAKSSSRCWRRFPRTKPPFSARGCSARRPMKGLPKRSFSSKRNGRRRSSSDCSNSRWKASSRSAAKPRRGGLRCAARRIESTCCRTARSASSTTS